MPLILQAGLWGLLAGAALVLGAVIGFKVKVPPRWIAGVMAFGSGVLISALAFELMEEAFERGGATAAGVGLLSGAALFTAVNLLLNRRGARHRKRSGRQQAKEPEHEGSGLAIAAGALLDGIPESIVIGVSLLGGGRVSLVAVVAIFLSNLPEGLSSAAGMKQAGRSAAYVFGVWGGIAALSGLAAMAGYYFFDDATEAVIAVTTTFAAGAILAMLAETMIPEAFEEAHDFTGLITVVGFLVSFCLSKVFV
ncbi:MAG: ZIP family zinc transporter [Opitutus sp.]